MHLLFIKTSFGELVKTSQVFCQFINKSKIHKPNFSFEPTKSLHFLKIPCSQSKFLCTEYLIIKSVPRLILTRCWIWWIAHRSIISSTLSAQSLQLLRVRLWKGPSFPSLSFWHFDSKPELELILLCQLECREHLPFFDAVVEQSPTPKLQFPNLPIIKTANLRTWYVEKAKFCPPKSLLWQTNFGYFFF